MEWNRILRMRLAKKTKLTHQQHLLCTWKNTMGHVTFQFWPPKIRLWDHSCSSCLTTLCSLSHLYLGNMEGFKRGEKYFSITAVSQHLNADSIIICLSASLVCDLEFLLAQSQLLQKDQLTRASADLSFWIVLNYFTWISGQYEPKTSLFCLLTSQKFWDLWNCLDNIPLEKVPVLWGFLVNKGLFVMNFNKLTETQSLKKSHSKPFLIYTLEQNKYGHFKVWWKQEILMYCFS